MGLEVFAEESGSVFAEPAIVQAESGGDVGVDVKFTDDFAVNKDGHNDFGFGFERAGEVTGVGIDVIDDDGFATGSRSAADSLIEGNARVGRHGAFEGTEDEYVLIPFPGEHIETDPIVTSEFFVEESDDALHEGVG